MARRILSLFISAALLVQSAGGLWAWQRPGGTFFEKSSWLDHASNTMRRVALRGERGAYDSYKPANPSSQNAYESVHVHQANLTDLSLYQNSPVYRRAKQLRDAFMPSNEPSPAGPQAELTEADIQEIRSAVAELMELYRTEGAYYPIVVQSVLEVALPLLPLQQQYQFFAARDLVALRELYRRILTQPAQCNQGSGYRIFCEGRADALESMALLARTEEDARLIAQVLQEDVQQPLIARELLAGAAALSAMGQERLLAPVLAKAVDKEPENFWQKIDVFMTGWWINKVQFSRGRYLGNVSAMAVLPNLYGEADGNAWEELARMLYNQGSPSPDAERLLAQYGLGSCEVELEDWAHGRELGKGATPLFFSVQCKTLLPFLTGALASGQTSGASKQLQGVAQRLHLSAPALVTRLYFENVMGDLNAQTEMRLDGLFYDVFEAEVQKVEKARREALEQNRQLDEQIKQLQQQLYDPRRSEENYFELAGAETMPSSLRLQAQILALKEQKTDVPSQTSVTLEKYNQDSPVYQRKETGQKIYHAAKSVSSVVDMGLGVYYTLALPAAAIKGVQWGLSLKRGLAAVRAGRINADVRKLAALSSRLKKLRVFRQTSAAKNAKQNLVKTVAALQPQAAPRPAAPAAAANTQAPMLLSLAGTDKTAAVRPALPAHPITLKAAPAASKPLLQAASSSKAGSSVLTQSALRTTRLAMQDKPVALALQSADWGLLAGSAQTTFEQMQALLKKWNGPADKLLKELSQNSSRMGRALRDSQEYVRLEQDLAFYQKLRAEKALPAGSFDISLSGKEVLFSDFWRVELADKYLALLQQKMVALPAGSHPGKAVLGKEIKKVLDIRDELVAPQELAWPKEGLASRAAVRRRLLDLQNQEGLSALQRKEVQKLIKEISFSPLDTEKLTLLQLRTMNVPFLQPSPNTLWVWGDEIGALSMLANKSPLGFPMEQIFRAQPFSAIAPFLRSGEENVIFLNGHGYISQNGKWKAVLGRPLPGETRPAATFSADKLVKAVLQADSPLTSVYINSCQMGSVFRDLKSLFEEFPQAAQKTEWFVSVAPLQPASSKPLPAFVTGNSVRERLLNKLLLNITDNGAGLAARAWVKGREVYPLRASITRIEREIAAAPKAEQAALQRMRDDLKLLFYMAEASDQQELISALTLFGQRHPGYVQHFERLLMMQSFMPETSSSFMWGLKPWKIDVDNYMVPFVRLEPKWVDYVADTAREMFGLFGQSTPSFSLSKTGSLLKKASQAEKDLQRAPQLFREIYQMQKDNVSGWREYLLSQHEVQDMAASAQWGRGIMRELETKWKRKGITTAAALRGDASSMRQALQDVSRFVELEKQTDAAQRLSRIYNTEAGFADWKEIVFPAEPSGIFARGGRKQLLTQYMDYLLRLRKRQPAQLHSATDREIHRAIVWGDRFDNHFLDWNARVLSNASGLRKQLEVLGKNKEAFSPFQLKEYYALERALYKKPVFGEKMSLGFQNRILFLPEAYRTPNSVFVWGDGLDINHAWARKTMVGFFQPQIVHLEPISQALRFFKSGQENILLAHVHGGISKKGIWKGLLKERRDRPNWVLSAPTLLPQLQQSRSLHSSIYVNGCFSGTFLCNVRKALWDYPDVLRKTDWFVTTARMQASLAEDLPAQFATGTSREILFSKMLQRMQYNGDGLAGRALLNGKDFYPLAQSVKRVRRQLRTAPPQQQKALGTLAKELELLRKVADSKTPRGLLVNLLELERACPGTVHNIGPWKQRYLSAPDAKIHLQPKERGIRQFCWGEDMTPFAGYRTSPVVELKKEWVDYVAQTAHEMFEKVPKRPKGVESPLK